MKTETRRLKYVATFNDETLPESTPVEQEVLYIDISNVNSRGEIEECPSMLFGDAPSRARRLVRDGDVIVSTVRTYLRAIAPIRDPKPELVVSTGFAVIRPGPRLDSRYAAYALQEDSFVGQVMARSNGVSYPAINPCRLVEIPVPVPTVSQQARVADFLDSEMSRLHSLVLDKERFIELLREKRAAVVADAVTKGLVPHAETIEAHVEWLDSYPAGWRMQRLKFYGARTTVGIVVTPAKYYVEDGIPALRSFNIAAGAIDTRDLAYISDEGNRRNAKSVLHAGDLVAVRTGNAGVAAIVPDQLDGANCIDLLIVRRTPELDSRYLRYFLNSRAASEQVRMHSVGSIQSHFNTVMLADMLVTAPDVETQGQIAAFLDAEAAHIDDLVRRTQASIDLLQEYRIALISAAVAGQIDIGN